MKATEQKEIRITLEMDQGEANWLMGVLQNGHPDEDPQDSKLRSQFFNAMKTAMTGYGVRDFGNLGSGIMGDD